MNLWQGMERIRDRHGTWVVACFFAVYFVKNFSEGLVKGGRWDLYQHIATADRFLEGQGFYYSVTEASSPYFPGLGFLSVFVGWAAYDIRDYVLLCLASVVGTAFLFALYWMARRFGAGRWTTLCVLVVFMHGFSAYQMYMNEFKADSLVLLFGFFACLVLECLEQQHDNRRWLLTVCLCWMPLFFLMGVFKQQALYIYIAIGLYVLATRRLHRREKAGLLFGMLLAGGLDLAVIFSVPDIRYTAIENLKWMPWFHASQIFHMFWGEAKQNAIYYLLLILAAYDVWKMRILVSPLMEKWMIVSVLFCAASFVGAVKIGGNAGNLQVGSLTFLPFAAAALERITSDPHLRGWKTFERIVAVFLALFLLSQGGKAAKGMLLGVPRALAERTAVVDYLRTHYEGERVMYFSDEYMNIKRAGLIPGTDIYSVPYNMPEYRDALEEPLERQEALLVYYDDKAGTGLFAGIDKTNQDYWNETTHLEESFRENYEKESFPGQPQGMRGTIYRPKRVE